MNPLGACMTNMGRSFLAKFWWISLYLSFASLGCVSPSSDTEQLLEHKADYLSFPDSQSLPPDAQIDGLHQWLSDQFPTADLGALTACQATDPRSNPLEISLLPDDGEKPFVDFISQAKHSVHVLIYLIGNGAILDQLKAKAREGLDVRVILDADKSSNQKYFEELKQAGAQVIWSDAKFAYMHAKIIIIDDKEAILSSGNFSYYGMSHYRDVVAKMTDQEDAINLSRIFYADWERREPDLSCTRLLVSPVNSRQRLLTLIQSAQQSLLIESLEFADYKIKGAVAERKKAGVDVRVVLANPGWITTNQEAADYLKQQDIPARYLDQPSLHTKEILVDGKWAYIGSVNLSYTSMNKNREIGVIFSDETGVKRLLTTFEKDWANASVFQ
jgi:phosphatidylserine/phosphatidylglycerophosphate/cardiolipin synthase-like enzyme